MLYRNTNIVMLIECTSITKKNGKFYTIEKPIEKSLWIDY